MGRFVIAWIALMLVVAALATPADDNRYGAGEGQKDGTHGVGDSDHSHGGLYEKSGATGGGAYGHGADGGKPPVYEG